MFLRIPSFHVTDESSRKRYGLVVFAIRFAKWTKQLVPFRRFIKLIRVIESVSRFMAHVHHDLAGVFQVIHLALQLLQFWIGKIKRDSDDWLFRGTSPLIAQINERA